MVTGMIALWSGAIVDIPAGFALCDGTNGTPDLRDRFVPGAGSTYNPGDNGGAASHQHTLNTDAHFHDLAPGSRVGPGATWDDTSDSKIVTGSTSNDSNLPPYYALAYIMKT